MIINVDTHNLSQSDLESINRLKASLLGDLTSEAIADASAIRTYCEYRDKRESRNATVILPIKDAIITDITVSDDKRELKLTLSDSQEWLMYHSQDCCEDVYIDDIIGDLNDLLNQPLAMAEKVTNTDGNSISENDLEMWTFFKFATIKGYVTLRWYGGSNGYYAVDVDFIRIK